jgi:hypothetical protein
MKRLALACGFVLALASLPGNAAAPENNFLDRFDGSWAGSGTVIRDDVAYDVTCRIEGQPDGNRVAIQGSCSVALASVSIAANIAFDPATGRYSGTYTGAEGGPARVTGRRSGNVVQFIVAWPQPVNGQTKARLVIENAGGGQLRIRLNEFVAPDGSEMTTHDLVLAQV